MVDELLVLRVERLGSSLDQLMRDLRGGYDRDAAVNSGALRGEARRLAEEWMVQVAPVPGVKAALGETVGDLNIEFTRLLTYSERRARRSLYDAAIRAIRRNFGVRVVIPLKQVLNTPAEVPSIVPSSGRAFSDVESAFVGHSFAPADSEIVDVVKRILMAFNIRVETGERPSASRISDKVKRRIDRCDAFVGIFTRRDRLSGRDAYTTSAWVIDEKAYAIARDKKLVVLKDVFVESIGGMQGDYEWIDFEGEQIVDAIVRLVELLVGD